MSAAVAPATFAPIHLDGDNERELCGHLPYKRAVQHALTEGYIAEFKDGRLAPWKWPVRPTGRPGDLERVPPEELLEHRNLFEFYAPGCLCAQDPDEGDFTESMIYFKMIGKTYAGQWVASCARSHCKYFVPLERAYTLPSFLLNRYPRKVAPLNNGPVDTFSMVQLASPSPSPAPTPKRKRQSSVILNTPRKRSRRGKGPVVVDDADADEEMSDFRKLLKLDDCNSPGLPLEVFKKMFRLCNCGLVMTVGAHYIRHDCPGKDVIDLTIDIPDTIRLIRGA